MKSAQATVSKVLNYSCVDGPGNRLVVFLQGCNFNCRSCHNPHTIGLCNHCGDCVPACPHKALMLIDGKVDFVPHNCDQCDACLKACSINANPMVQIMSVESVLARLLEHHLMLDGITLSGGEATLQADFIVALFTAIKADVRLRHLSCFIDSNGQLGRAAWQRLLPITDGVLLDIKAIDIQLHQALTGRPNQRVMQSLRTLHQARRLHELRYLVIPGFTDQPSEVQALAELVLSLDANIPVRLNAFQHHGVIGPAREWPKARQHDIQVIVQQLQQAGVREIITPAVYV